MLFQNNCAACHGEDAKGLEGTGAPNLTDADWLYGGDAATIRADLAERSSRCHARVAGSAVRC